MSSTTARGRSGGRPEGLALVVEGHDERVRHGARLSGMPQRRPAATSDVPAAPQIQAARAAARAASTPWSRRAEKSTNDRSPQARATRAALEASIVWLAMRLSSHVSDQLGLDHGRGDPHQRLAGEHHLALGHGPHLAGEAQAPSRSRKSAGNRPQPGQVVDVRGVEGPRLQPGQGVVEAGRHQEAPLGRQAAHEQLEGGLVVDAAGLVRGGHGELVQVGDQGATRSRRPSPERHARVGHGVEPPAARRPARARPAGCRPAPRSWRSRGAPRRARSP